MRMSETKRRGKRQAGFTLLEAMIAGFVMAFGLLAIAVLFVLAIGNNGRSRVDTTATMLSESVIEQIAAVLARGGPSSMTDCASTPTTWLIDTSVGGAALSGSGIDFSRGEPALGFLHELRGVQRRGRGEHAGHLRRALERGADVHQHLPGDGGGAAKRDDRGTVHVLVAGHIPDLCGPQ